MKKLFPDLYVNSISEITASMLREKGMEAVVLDIDNTLVPHNDPEPTKEVMDFLSDMKKSGIKVCVVSNNRYARVEPFCKRIGVEYFVHGALKPRKYGYVQAARILKSDCGRTAAVGDQIFTDIWGGNRAGCFTILVEPLDKNSENILIKFKRIFEKPFIRKVMK